jgi:hypothetical protein
LAFVFKPNQAKDKNNPQGNQAPGQGQSVTGGEGSVITGQNPAGANPGGQKASSSGRFSNIQSFIKANDASKLGDQFTGKIGEETGKAQGQLSEAKSAVDKSAQSTGEAVAAARAKNSGLGQTLAGAYQAQGGPVSEEQFGQNLAGLKQNLGMQYQGVEDLGNQDVMRAQAQNLSAMGQATQSASGRNALLNRFYGTPQYAAGQRTLDTVLLGSQRPKLQQAASQANSFGGQLDTARRTALGQVGQAREGVTNVVNETNQAVQGQIGSAKGAIGERATQLQAIRDLLRKPDADMQMQQDVNQPAITGDARSDAALRQAMSSGFIDQGQMDAFKALSARASAAGMGQGRDLLNESLLQGDQTGDELNKVAASTQQVSRLKGLQDLIAQPNDAPGLAYDPMKNPYDISGATAKVSAREAENARVAAAAAAGPTKDLQGDYQREMSAAAQRMSGGKGSVSAEQERVKAKYYNPQTRKWAWEA